MSDTAERMTRVDNAWLRMDNDVNLMMIVGVWLLQPALRYEQVCERIEQRLLQYPRFRQKVVRGRARRQLGRRRRLRHHPPRGARDAAAQARPERARRAAGSAAANWPRRRSTRRARCGSSTWSSTTKAAARSIVRIHHCIGDGIALTSVVLSITDGGATRRAQRSHDGDARRRRLADDAADQAADRPGGQGHRPVRRGRRRARWTWWPIRSSRARASWRAAGYAWSTDAGRAGADGRRLADAAEGQAGRPQDRRLGRADPAGRGQEQSARRWARRSTTCCWPAWPAPSATTCASIGDDPRARSIRAMVPVNLRPLDEAYKLGNRFGLAPLVLPIGIDNPIERVYAVRARMSRAQGQLPAAAGLRRAGRGRAAEQAGAGRAAQPVRQEGHRGDDQRARPDAAAQVLRLDAAPEHLLGAAVGRRGVGVSIFSYGGGVQFGADHRRAAVPGRRRRSSTASRPSSRSCCG